MKRTAQGTKDKKFTTLFLSYSAIFCAVLILVLGSAQIANAATFTVSTTADSGSGSLREAITLANGAAGADTINFGVAGTITPLTPLPTITDT
ncbi:MAG: hypothetical protein ABI891_16275, partial [Acidobacteriota bacterium]